MINQFIVQGSDKWSESIYNEDQDFKYVSMLRSDNDATNLPQVRGTGEEHFRYFVENRLNYCDSKWYAGDYPEDNAIVRIYTPVDAEGVPRTDLVIPANADITVTPYSAMYAGVRYKANGTLYQERLEENETYTFEAPNEIFNDTETAIYGASQLSSLGDLAPLYLGYIDVGAATKLVELKIGDGTPGYLNSNLYHLAVGTNRLLKKIDIQNCAGPKFSQALVLSGCPNIEEVYAKGSSITGVDLPESGYLKILQLPATIANLTLKNQPYLNDLTIEGLTNLKTITIENTPVDTLSILSGATNVERVRLTNVDWHHEDASILYELINRDIGGIDENGVNTDTMWIDGKCHIEELTGNELLEIKTLYPYLDITYTTLESQIIYMSEDGQTELTRKTIYNGGNDSCPVESGAIERPTKESTAQYDYEFNGWSLTPGGQVDNNALNKVEADRRVYAAFKNVLRNYTVKFMNGSKEETSKVVAYGTDAAPCGKNLFNSAMFTVDNVGHGSSGTLILSAYIPFSGGMLDKACMNLAVGETYVWSGNNLNDILFGNQTLKPNRPFVLTQEMLESNRLGFYALNTTNATTPYTITNIQLELGETPTVFEAYNTIVPVNNSTGDASDFEFTGWKPEPVDITGDTVCYAQYYDNREITDDWATIEAACLEGTATEKYPIGSYKPVTIIYDKLPYDFYDGNAVVYKDEIHIMGGVDGAKNHYKFNGEEWVEVGSLPYDLYWGAATIYQDEIHILGSYANGQSKKHYKYNDTDGWTEVSTLPVFFNRGSVAVYNDELHMIGGLGNATHYKYNPTDGWTLIGSINVFYDGGAVVLDGKIHIFGGSTVKGHRVYDGSEWITLDDLPYSMIRGQAIIYNNEAHILGSDYSSVDSISHYTLNASGTFTRTYDLPYYCARFATIIYDDKLHILGSYNTTQRKSHYLLDSGEWIPNGDYETINMEVIAHNHDELTDGVNKWERLSDLPYYYGNGCTLVYNNEIHLLGGKYSQTAHYKWDGSTYTSIGILPFAKYESCKAVVYDNAIHAIGLDSENLFHHYKFDGTEWSEVADVSELMLNTQWGKVLLGVSNDSLYAFGYGGPKGVVYKFDNTSWTEVTTLDYSLWDFGIYTFNDEIYIFSTSELFKWNESEIVKVATLPFGATPVALMYNDEIHIFKTSVANGHYKLVDGKFVYVEDTTPISPTHGQLAVYNNEIHLIGTYGVFNNSKKHYKWSTAGWEQGEDLVNLSSAISSHQSFSGSPMKMNGQTYLVSSNTLVLLQNNEKTNVVTTSTPPFSTNSPTFAIYNNELYGTCTAGATHVTTGTWYKWNGGDSFDLETGWTAVCPCNLGGMTACFVEYDGYLHCLGGYYTNDTNRHVKFDGTEWTTVDGFVGGTSVAATVYNDKLHAFVNENHYVYDGTSWELLETLSFGETLYITNRWHIASDSKYIYLIAKVDEIYGFYRWDGSTWKKLGVDQSILTGNFVLFEDKGKIRLCIANSVSNYYFRNPRATLTFFAKEAMKDSVQTGSHANGYLGTGLKTCVDSIFENLSNDVKNIIKPVDKYIALKPSDRTITSIEESCWLMSANEVGFMGGDRYPDGEGVPYGVFTDKASRIRSNVYWWTRSMNFLANNPSYYWTTVTPIGALGNGSKDDKNVCIVFGFCI